MDSFRVLQTRVKTTLLALKVLNFCSAGGGAAVLSYTQRQCAGGREEGGVYLQPSVYFIVFVPPAGGEQRTFNLYFKKLYMQNYAGVAKHRKALTTTTTGEKKHNNKNKTKNHQII